MSLMKKIFSPLRNAFSYACHLESAADHDRKPASVEKMMAISLPPPDGADEGYTQRLRAVLMRTRTKQIDTLLSNEIRVVLDDRLPAQKLEAGDRRIDGIYYDRPGARAVAVWDDGGRPDKSWLGETPAYFAPVMLEKLAEALNMGTKGDLFASRYTTADAMAGMGMGVAGAVTYTAWKNAEGFEPGAMAKNPALCAPKQKPAPKP